MEYRQQVRYSTITAHRQITQEATSRDAWHAALGMRTRQQSQSHSGDGVHDDDEENQEANWCEPPPVRVIVAVCAQHRLAQGLRGGLSLR